MDIDTFKILIGLGTLLLTLYFYLTLNFDFWKKRNVQGPRPIPIFGNFKDVILGKTHMALQLQKFCNEFKNESLIGIYVKSAPVLILKDLDLIKDVLIKDFNVFPDRDRLAKVANDPLSENLLNLEHERWRPLRNRLSPAFTSGKLKNMFYLMAECAGHLENYVAKVVENNESVEVRELTAKFTTESIGVCMFGLNTNALADEDSEFRKYGRALFYNGFKSELSRILREMSPRIYGLLETYLQNDALGFFVKFIQETMAYRKKNKKNGSRRNDFVDLLLDLQDQPEKLNTFEFTDDLLIAQALIFFIAGFETSSTTMSNALYELALNQDVQDKLRDDIRHELQKSDGKMTYDNIKNMKYLDKVVKESLRKYPPGSNIQRRAISPYTFYGIKVSIPAGTKIFIPVWAIHRDPELYPDPDVFEPERFNEENEKNRHPMSYLPFGDGPHNCIGDRFAKYQTKVGIAALINKFKVNVCDKTLIPYSIEAVAVIPTPIGGIHLKITKL